MIEHMIGQCHDVGRRRYRAPISDDFATTSPGAERTIADVELDPRVPYEQTLRDIRCALEDAGIVFLFDGAVGIGAIKAGPA